MSRSLHNEEPCESRARPARTRCIQVPERIGADGQRVPAASLYARIQGTRPRGHRCSRKPTLLFVHGTSASNIYWRCVQEAFAALGYFTVAPDLRGQGQSQQTPADQLRYTNTVFAEDIHEQLASLGVHGDIVWCGLSIGGTIAVEYYRLYPAALQRIVMISSSAWYQRGNPLGIGISSGSTPDELLPENCPEQLVDAKAAVRQNQARSAPIVPSIIANTWTENQTALFETVQIPVLVGYGSIDPLLPNGTAATYSVAHLPNAVLVEFVGKGHLLPITAWRDVVRVIRRFLHAGPFASRTTVLNTGCQVCTQVRPVADFTACPALSA